MPMPFRQMTVAEAEAQIEAAIPLRAIRFIDTHHTYIPTRAQWRGEATVKAMHRFHTAPPKWVERNGVRVNVGGQGWADIAQHWTLGPDGAIWTGRNLGQMPCSQTGFNAGSLMYELVGNFCAPDEPGTRPPYDTLDGLQLAAAVALSAAVLARFALPLSAVRFHRQLHAPGRSPPKTCPGLTVDYDGFAALVEDRCRARWRYDAPGRTAFDPAAEFDAADVGGSAHDSVADTFDAASFGDTAVA